MLTDQHIVRPIHFVIGPEVFYEDNAMGLNLACLKDFREIIVPSGMFRFTYVAFANSRIYGPQAPMSERLKDAGIPLDVVLIGHKEDCERNQVMLREVLYMADGYFRNACLKALGVSRSRIQFPYSRDPFVKSLTIQAQTIAAWDWIEFTTLWDHVRN